MSRKFKIFDHMKKSIAIIGAIFIACLMLVSCGGSEIGKDAKKLALLQCEARKEIAKVTQDAALAGTLSATTTLEVSKKWMEKEKPVIEEMAAKYTTKEDKQKFANALEKALQDCK